MNFLETFSFQWQQLVNQFGNMSSAQLAAALVDFAIITILIYGILYFLRGTRSANVLFGVTVLLLIVKLLAELFKLIVISSLLSQLGTILGIAIIVIFQPEIRRLFAQAGSVFFHTGTKGETIGEVVDAAFQMSASRTGALIVFERNIGLEGIVNTSEKLDAKVNSKLLQSIFFKNSPLHDCAVIIKKNRIIAARAVLPLSQEIQDDPAGNYGTRHRAAIGITEETDSVALVVSEETGLISLACKGRLTKGYTRKALAEHLKHRLLDKEEKEKTFREGADGKNPYRLRVFDGNEQGKEASHDKSS